MVKFRDTRGLSVDEAELVGAPAAVAPTATGVPVATGAYFRYRLERRLTAARSILAGLTHNERVLYTEVLFQALSDAGAIAFLSVFLVRLGASNWQVGLFSALPALMTTLSALPAGAFVNRQRNLVRVVLVARLIYRSIVALLALLPLFPVDIAPYVMIGAYSIASIFSSTFDVSFTTLLGQAAPPNRRARLLSTRLAIHGTVATGVSLLVGQWLDWAPYPLNYQLLFVSALVVGIGGTLVLARFKQADAPQAGMPQAVPPSVKTPSVKTPPVKARVSLRDMRALFTQAPAFRDFVITALLFRVAVAMPNSLYVIYRVRVLGTTDAWLGVLLTVERFLSVLAYFTLARLLTNPKYRRWLWVSCLGIALYPLTMALSHTPEMLLIPSVLTGLFGAGMTIYLTDTLFQVSPESDRPSYVATNSFLANVAAFVGPMLGTLMAGFTGIHLALGVIGGLRMLSALGFRRVTAGEEKQPEGAKQAL